MEIYKELEKAQRVEKLGMNIIRELIKLMLRLS